MDPQPKRILIVDDDRDLQDMFNEILSMEGYKVLTASNGAAAFSLLHACTREELPSLIILDSQMPEMNGRQFLNAIREHASEDLRRIEILVSSGDGPLVDGFPAEIKRIRKPMDLTDFLQAVSDSVGP
jgi:two-component system OmpR family response regulator